MAMSEPRDTAPAQRHGRRRRILVCTSFVLLVLLLLAAAAAITVLVVIRPRDPTTDLLSATATGAAPRVVAFPTISVQLNVTFLIVVRVRNPNLASFRHGEGAASLLYRGARVGDAVVPAGTVPSRGETTVRMDMTVQGDRVVAAAGLMALVGDVLDGEIEFETGSEVKGRITFLWFVKRRASARSVCRIVIGVADVKVRRQECHNEAKL